MEVKRIVGRKMVTVTVPEPQRELAGEFLATFNDGYQQCREDLLAIAGGTLDPDKAGFAKGYNQALEDVIFFAERGPNRDFAVIARRVLHKGES